MTLILLTYNQELFVREAVKSALSQTYEPLEVIVSDDASSDSTWDVVTEETSGYVGPHKVVARRNKFNLGLAVHLDHLSRLAKGELIVVAAGDDISAPHRVKALVDAWAECGFAEGALHSNSRIIDASGAWTGRYKKGAASDSSIATLNEFVDSGFAPMIQGATAAYTRSVFERFGPLRGSVEDGPMTFRALLIGRLMYVDEVLVSYRVGVGNASGALRRRDRARIGRWIEGVLDMLRLYRRDYNQFCADIGTEPSIVLLRRLSALERRYRMAGGLASPHIAMNVLGLLALPNRRGLLGKLYIAARYFGVRK